MSDDVPPLPLDETTPRMSRSRLLKAVAVGVAIFVAVNAAFTVAMGQVTVNRGYDTIRHKWQLIERQTEPVDWLLVGDSSCNQGLDPRVFVDELGQTALNLCTTGDMLAVGDVWFAERYIEQVGPPRRGILMTHVYDVWPRNDEAIKALAWVIPGGDEWRRTRPVVEADPHERVVGVIGPWFPLYAQPQSVKRLLLETNEVRSAPPLSITEDGFREAGPPDEDAVEDDLDKHLAPASPEQLATSAVNREALTALAELAEREGVPLVVSPSPLVDVLWADPTFQRRFELASETVVALAAEDPNVHLLAEAPWRYAASEMQNADHVAEPTATRHTAAVTAALEQAGLTGP